ncbi:immunoglobulin superfamily member 1-like isoform 2-T2 [Liasis olivaceus]
MRLIFNLFLLGWWLARQRWMAEGLYPQPSISVNPSNVVAVGEHIRISCKMERNPANKTITFVLMKEISGQWHEIYPTITTQSNEAVLHIVGAQKFHGGIYSCIYKISSLQSYFSNLTYIFVREQIHPSPSISVIPSDMVVRGEKVTIQCTNEYDQYAEFSLIKQGASDQLPTKRTQKKMAEFLIPSAQESDGGIYFCDYRLYQSYDRYSKFSNRTYINITDPSLTKPSIQIIHEDKDAPEAKIFIRCNGTNKDLAFALLKSREQIAYKAAEPKKKAVDFVLHQMRLEEAQSYTCQYHHRSSPFVWSEPSDPLELPWGAGLSTTLSASIAAGLFLLAIFLVFVLILYRKRRKGSTVKERNLPVKMLSEPAIEETPDEVSYAAINHNSLKIKSKDLPDTAPESCVYAAVSTKRTKEIQ